MSSPTSVIRDWRRGVGGAASDLTPSTLVGAEVRFRGLVSRNDLNGAFGKVKGWIEDRGRLEVRIMDRDGIEGESICVKVDNVEADACAMPGCDNLGRKWCTRCHQISYCGKACQSAHSHTHRAECAARHPSIETMHDAMTPGHPSASARSFSDAEWKQIAGECMFQDRHLMQRRMYQSAQWNARREHVPQGVQGGAERLATTPRIADFFVYCDFTGQTPTWSVHLTQAFYEGTDLPKSYDLAGRDHLEFTLPMKTLWAKHFGEGHEAREGSPKGKVMMAIMRGEGVYQVFNAALMMRDKVTNEAIPMVSDDDLIVKGHDDELLFADKYLVNFAGPKTAFAGKLSHPKLMNEHPEVSRFKAMCDDPTVSIETLEAELEKLKTTNVIPRESVMHVGGLHSQTSAAA
tara:strand:+ start:291 stop:1505 length:1215 start_codon:yes stop_codon:yes gene_type:complete